MAAAVAILVTAICLGMASAAAGAPPSTPVIFEPAENNQVLSPADVHMEAVGFSDPDDDSHDCSDWEIRTQSSSEVVWEAPCAAGLEKVHIHLGDGTFVNSHAGRTALEFDSAYALRVRFRDSGGETGAWAERPFLTAPAGPPGQPGSVPWAARGPGITVEIVASDFQLPVNVAMVPRPGAAPSDPFLYVSELYGTIKVVSRDGTVSDYATGLLNFDPTGHFPGSGEQGLTGIVVEPKTGDVFASLLYEDTDAIDRDPKPHYPKVIRLHSEDGGLTAASETTMLDMDTELQGQSHQISNLTIGPDRKLYVHNGDGFNSASAQNLDSFRGKVLRLNQDGSAPTDNPFHNAADGISARDYVFAYGFRNPFGGAWRAGDEIHYQVENGPFVDRFSQVVAGRNYGWNGTDDSLRAFALYNWNPSHAPVNIAFHMDHAFVTESGPTWATGPQVQGKRIVEFAPGADGSFAGSLPSTLVEYTGAGKATAAGLEAGPDGLYFTDLYKDLDYASPIDRGANLLRVRWPESPAQPAVPAPASAASLLALVTPAEARRDTALSGGLRMAVGCRGPCTVRTALRRKRRLLGRTTGGRAGAGQLTLPLRFRRRAVKLVGSSRRLALHHDVAAREQDHGEQAFSPRLVLRRMGLARQLRRGLRLNLGCSAECHAVARLSLPGKTAARAPAASGSAVLERAGLTRLTARFTRAARRRLRRVGGGRLRLSVEVQNGSAAPTVLSYRVRF